MKSEHEFKVVEMKCEHEFAPSASIRRSTHLQALDVDRKDRREECELEKVVDDEDDRAEADPFSHDLSNPVSERLHTQVSTSQEVKTHRDFHPPEQAKREKLFDD